MSRHAKDLYFPMKKKEETTSIVVPIRKRQRQYMHHSMRQFPPAEVRDTPVLDSLERDADGLPTVEEIQSHPELLKSVDKTTKDLLLAKVRGQEAQKRDVIQAQIAAPRIAQRARADAERQHNAEVAELRDLQNHIDRLPTDIRASLQPMLQGLTAYVVRGPSPYKGFPGSLTPAATGTPGSMFATPGVKLAPPPTLPPPLTPYAPVPVAPPTLPIDREQATVDALNTELSKNKTYKSESAFKNAVLAQMRSAVNEPTAKLKQYKKHLDTAVQHSGRDPESILAPKNGVPVKLGSGLKIKVVKLPKSKYMREVISGVNLPKHFKKFMYLARKHMRGGELTEHEMSKLANYETLNGAGHFTKVFDTIKSGAKHHRK
jgi:hypothetical protein